MQDLADGPWRQSNLDAGASMIIPVPAPMGGAIVLGESVIAYMGHGQQMKCTEITPTIIRVRTDSMPYHHMLECIGPGGTRASKPG